VSPWSRAEPGDESKDRALFARRARAQAAGGVPSLADVMRALDKSRDELEARRARNRALVGMALAAACVAASITGVRSGRRDGIVADPAASSAKVASGTTVTSGAAMTSAREEPPAGECERQDEANDSHEQVVAMSTVPPACYAPPTDFAATASCDSDQAPICASEESCSTATR
jgi:hypothetical protein